MLMLKAVIKKFLVTTVKKITLCLNVMDLKSYLRRTKKSSWVKRNCEICLGAYQSNTCNREWNCNVDQCDQRHHKLLHVSLKEPQVATVYKSGLISEFKRCFMVQAIRDGGGDGNSCPAVAM